jgi:hypothetical protein
VHALSRNLLEVQQMGNTLNLVSLRNAWIVFRADTINGTASDDALPWSEVPLIDASINEIRVVIRTATSPDLPTSR